MCGRFTLTSPIDEVAEYFRVLEGGWPQAAERPPRYNIAPTQPVACVRQPAEGGREIVEMRWGLIPYWAEDPAIGNRMINARAETLATRSAYKEPFRRRRCLVVADGFYEWRKEPGGKQPYYVYMADKKPFGFAGLWDRWRPRAGRLEGLGDPERAAEQLSADGRLESCAIVTGEPNELLEPIHDRMPVIVAPEHWEAWLDPELDEPESLQEILRTYPAERMRAHPVSTHVNKPANDDPECIRPLAKLKIKRPDEATETSEPPSPQRELF